MGHDQDMLTCMTGMKSGHADLHDRHEILRVDMNGRPVTSAATLQGVIR